MQKKRKLKQHGRTGLSHTITYPIKRTVFHDNGRLQAYKSFKASHIHVYERCRHFRRG